MDRSLQGRCAWFTLATSCAAYLLVSLAHHQALHPWGRLNFFDLRVYRGAARLVLSGRPLYGGSIWHWAPFTYPPFAALVFTALALLPFALDEVLVTALGMLALFALASLALRLPSASGEEPAGPQRWRSMVASVAVAAALWLEPITATLGYGQVNLLIALLIVCDLSRGDAALGKGVLIGIAAGLKLTPLIFVPYLLFSRRRRPAMVALGTFASTIAVAFVALPGDARRYWAGGLFLDARRVGGCCVPANQSLRGVILRLDPPLGSAPLLGLAAIVAVAGLLLAVMAGRRGDEAMGFSLCAITGLLISPVSWTHHWTLAVPALLLFGVRVVRRRSTVGIAGLVVVTLLGFSYLPKLMAKPAFAPGRRLSVGWMLASSPYVLIGSVALAVAAIREIHGVAAARTARRTVSRPTGLTAWSRIIDS